MRIEPASRGTNVLFARPERSTRPVTGTILDWWAHDPKIPGSFSEKTGLQCEESLNLGEGQPFANHQSLITGITSEDMYHYRVAQAEALALLEWVKKFALAFMVVDEEELEAGKKGER